MSKVVLRGSVLFLILALGEACGSGRAETDDAALAPGRAFVEKTCIGCHPGADLDVRVKKRLDTDAPDALDRFLVTHYAGDAAIRAAVVHYLENRIQSAAPDSVAR